MSRFRHIIAVLLLTLWLPTTQHCGLEAAGLIAPEPPHAEADCCDATRNPCTHDGCNVVENGLAKPANGITKVSAPVLAACACFLCFPLLYPDVSAKPTPKVTSSRRPQPWVPIWQFARRAAPLSRAPSFLG